ncbi:MAG: bifunctional 4-hydroxy-2-oxoglutarate aldolase/2-dehydro-3-deoxy-phosphogluconate aldolase [Anaerolineales bacterium]|nr:bifunctional 4-hydroxy-2-oxoglutarate aldolase/2-dehydro-3-deoxy-phosphogluconate aldolase [Anaerolineales bacterium]
MIQKQKTLERVRELGLLAVIRGPSPEVTLETVAALIEGGVLGIEITYTTPQAADVVQNLDKKFGEQILLGMGTLTKIEQIKEARDAGARFIVSPHLEPELADAMVASGLGVMIGALTPSEIVQAFNIGSDVVKVFPGSLGGPAYMKALRGPFPDIPMMPTGGVNPDNLVAWFKAGAVAVGAGSSLCPAAWAKEGRFKDITQRAKEFVEAVEMARNIAA